MALDDRHHIQTAPRRLVLPRGIRVVIVIIEAVALTVHLLERAALALYES
jgi:hypothetical protein